jgi:hypothetical protein
MTTQTTHSVEVATPTTPSSNWNLVCHIAYTRDTWVKLLHLKNEYAFDEAKLLCQESSDVWVVWIPDYGQATLNKSDFYC